MPHYRLYCCDPSGHVLRPATVLECETDDAAMAAAAHNRSVEWSIEVWDGARLVGRHARLEGLEQKSAPSQDQRADA